MVDFLQPKLQLLSVNQLDNNPNPILDTQHHAHSLHNTYSTPTKGTQHRDVHPVFSAVSTQTRGKEREIPKKKKLSVTKKIVLKERQERKDNQSKDYKTWPESSVDDTQETESNSQPQGITAQRRGEIQHEQISNVNVIKQPIPSIPPHLLLPHFLPRKTDPSASPPISPSQQFPHYTPHQLSHFQQINALTSDSYQQTYVTHPHLQNAIQAQLQSTWQQPKGDGNPPVADRVQSFVRPYITNRQTKELDELAFVFISTLHQFEVNKKKALSKNPLKFKKRLVAGIKEVSKKLSVHKLKCVIASPSIC